MRKNSFIQGALILTVAGIIVKFHVSTVRTLGDVVAKATGFTIQDSMCCFFLYA